MVMNINPDFIMSGCRQLMVFSCWKFKSVSILDNARRYQNDKVTLLFQVEAEANKQAEDTTKELPVTGEKVETLTDDDDDEEAEVMVHEEEEKLYEDEVESEIKEADGESSITIDDEEAEPDHSPTLDEEVEIE